MVAFEIKATEDLSVEQKNIKDILLDISEKIENLEKTFLLPDNGFIEDGDASIALVELDKLRVKLKNLEGEIEKIEYNITSQLDPNSSTYLGHNHGSFEITQSKGSLQAPETYPVNDISMGTVAPDNIDNALNIIAEVSMPALICTFIIKAY